MECYHPPTPAFSSPSKGIHQKQTDLVHLLSWVPTLLLAKAFALWGWKLQLTSAFSSWENTLSRRNRLAHSAF